MRISKTEQTRLEGIAKEEFLFQLGHVVDATCIMGYNDSDDSVEIYFDEPVKVRVLPTAESDICHWNDEWLDPYWDVALAQECPETLKGIRSLWIDGPSHQAGNGGKS